VPPREVGADLSGHGERSKFVHLAMLPEAGPGKRNVDPSDAPTPFASDPQRFHLKTDPADLPSTKWHLAPGLNAEPRPQGVGRRVRIVLKSNF